MMRNTWSQEQPNPRSDLRPGPLRTAHQVGKGRLGRSLIGSFILMAKKMLGNCGYFFLAPATNSAPCSLPLPAFIMINYGSHTQEN